ncbi:MAG: RagB/SusD family nutrient uptake outer membrane protein [Mucilaginibacter sp.]|uniref:RagB/SusD family nutrient uptake outer membrane protein n=1 Tax=Mucilaginibacter sp. TaxID=1882438 RepID=UPI0031A712F4
MKSFKNKPVNLTRYAVLLLSCFTLVTMDSGCKKALDSKVYSQLTPENFYKSESDINAAVITIYSPFSSNWDQTDPGNGNQSASLYNADIKTYLLKSIMTTDEAGTDWDQNLTNFTFGPATYQGLGNSVYPFISYVAKATDVINNISQVTSVSDNVKKKYLAETKVLRAWLMFVLYDFFGPVNAKTDPATLSSNTITPRPTAEVYCAQIENDLTSAIPDLPAKYNTDNTNWGRMSQGMAQMLLLKLYMQNKQWAKAEATAKTITTMGYSLMPNYADVFNVKQNNELIYAVPTNSSSPNYWMQEVLPGDFASAGNITRGAGWAGYYMPWAFYDKYEAADTRKNTIIASYTTSAGKIANRASGLRGAIPLKYTGIAGLGDGPGYNFDVVVFRYAEVLLSLAEAINEQRGPADAYQYVNMVRSRAGVSAFSGMSTEQFRAALLDERGRELYCEGTRRQDLVRQGQLISNAIARGKTSAQPFMTLFPIPSDVMIQGNGIIKQNPGYSN